MFKRIIPVAAAVAAVMLVAVVTVGAGNDATVMKEETRQFKVSSGGTLVLDLEAGGSVKITGGGSGVTVDYRIYSSTSSGFSVDFKESGDNLEVRTLFTEKNKRQSSEAEFDIQVPSHFNIEIDSGGGALEIDGVEGTFEGKTMGGELTLRDVRGEARLTTMGGAIRLSDSELDGWLKTMGGEVLFENVVGDVHGSSMGGNVKYKNVVRRDGILGTLAKLGNLEVTGDTVQITTMGGAIDIDDAPEGAALHTMGGDITVRDAAGFVKAKTMGGDILIESVDGWVKATTMGGDVEVTMVGSGGEVELVSMSGEITLTVPAGFPMNLDLEIAYTRNSNQNYRIITDEAVKELRTREWDYGHGSPRKYIRATSSTGGGNTVKIRTINGNITIVSDG